METFTVASTTCDFEDAPYAPQFLVLNVCPEKPFDEATSRRISSTEVQNGIRFYYEDTPVRLVRAVFFDKTKFSSDTATTWWQNWIASHPKQLLSARQNTISTGVVSSAAEQPKPTDKSENGPSKPDVNVSSQQPKTESKPPVLTLIDLLKKLKTITTKEQNARISEVVQKHYDGQIQYQALYLHLSQIVGRDRLINAVKSLESGAPLVDSSPPQRPSLTDPPPTGTSTRPVVIDVDTYQPDTSTAPVRIAPKPAPAPAAAAPASRPIPVWYVHQAAENRPSKRWGHSAVVIENVMWVFGGSGSKHFNDVRALDLGTLSWSKVQTNGPSPSPRDSHSAVVYNTSMVIFGGSNSESRYNDTHFFDTFTRRWSRPHMRGRPPPEREGHTATVLRKKWMIIFGGCDQDTQFGDIWMCNLDTLLWNELQWEGIPPSPRDSHSAVAITNRIFIFGGQATETFFQEVFALSFDDSAFHEQSVTAPAYARSAIVSGMSQSPSPRAGHQGVAYQDKYMMIVGGEGPAVQDGKRSEDTNFHSDTWFLNIHTNQWLRLSVSGAKFVGRFSHTTVIWNNRLYTFGGMKGASGGKQETVFLNDISILAIDGKIPVIQQPIAPPPAMSNQPTPSQARFMTTTNAKRPGLPPGSMMTSTGVSGSAAALVPVKQQVKSAPKITALQAPKIVVEVPLEPGTIIVPKISPKFLESLAAQQEWSFAAIAHLVDNAVDTDVHASHVLLTVEMVDPLIPPQMGINIDSDLNPQQAQRMKAKLEAFRIPMLVIQDDGTGMSIQQLSRLMVGYGHNRDDVDEVHEREEARAQERKMKVKQEKGEAMDIDGVENTSKHNGSNVAAATSSSSTSSSALDAAEDDDDQYLLSGELRNRFLSLRDYGVGFKAACMRLGRDVVVLTKTTTSLSVAMLSLSFMFECRSKEVVVPIVGWDRATKDLLSKNSVSSLRLLHRYSPLNTPEKLQEQFDKIATTGTRVLIFNLQREREGYELQFSDPSDVYLLPPSYVRDRFKADSTNTNVRSANSSSNGSNTSMSTVNGSTDVIMTEYNPEVDRNKKILEGLSLGYPDYSLSCYLSLLYLRSSRVKLTLRGREITSLNVHRSLYYSHMFEDKVSTLAHLPPALIAKQPSSYVIQTFGFRNLAVAKQTVTQAVSKGTGSSSSASSSSSSSSSSGDVTKVAQTQELGILVYCRNRLLTRLDGQFGINVVGFNFNSNNGSSAPALVPSNGPLNQPFTAVVEVPDLFELHANKQGLLRRSDAMLIAEQVSKNASEYLRHCNEYPEQPMSRQERRKLQLELRKQAQEKQEEEAEEEGAFSIGKSVLENAGLVVFGLNTRP
eukprot:GILJ01008199.1.p1 GENE.GILJ01008199.1~~GILJ01008199.1.p1  ORF type:complete len:1333 (-),score=224.94 GILJ01008199.1:1192-5190(-)